MLKYLQNKEECLTNWEIPQHSSIQTLGYEPSTYSQMFHKVHWFHLSLSKKSLNNNEKRAYRHYLPIRLNLINLEKLRMKLTDLHPSTEQSYHQHQAQAIHSNTSNNICWLLFRRIIQSELNKRKMEKNKLEIYV